MKKRVFQQIKYKKTAKQIKSVGKMTDKAPSDSTALEVHENHDSDAVEHHMNAQYLLNSPAYMSSAVRRQLLQEMVKGLPANVQKRINALRNIELERLNLEAKFYEEVIFITPNTWHSLNFHLFLFPPVAKGVRT